MQEVKTTNKQIKDVNKENKKIKAIQDKNVSDFDDILTGKAKNN